jgi:calcineurin-like phosphoesterase family protein
MTKRTLWVTSDPHFNHFNILKYCDRPFIDVDDMNAAIIARYNQKVKPTDICYFLGDIGTGTTEELTNIIQSLNGTKILIRGNHDKASLSAYLNMGFSAVLDSVNLRVGASNVHLRHVPSRTWLHFIHLCWIWARDMRVKGRTWRQVYERLCRELKYHTTDKDSVVLCGHVHNTWKVRGNNVNVGVDVHAFKPVKLYDVIRLADV